jgi:hypothetical protein
MSWRNVFRLTVFVTAMAMTSSVWAQSQTGAITGRATDTSGGALPGVTVSITSPNMIGYQSEHDRRGPHVGH